MNNKRNYVFAKTLGALMPAITRPVFEKFGFQRAALLSEWDVIIGEPLSQFTAPEQIKWPKVHDDHVGDETRKEVRAREGATLVIRVEGPVSLEVQHQSQQIIERINSYFGYRAVSQIRILQAPLERRKVKPQTRALDLDKPVQNEAKLPEMDDRLELALKRMWRGIQSRKIND